MHASQQGCLLLLATAPSHPRHVPAVHGSARQEHHLGRPQRLPNLAGIYGWWMVVVVVTAGFGVSVVCVCVQRLPSFAGICVDARSGRRVGPQRQSKGRVSRQQRDVCFSWG